MKDKLKEKNKEIRLLKKALKPVAKIEVTNENGTQRIDIFPHYPNDDGVYFIIKAPKEKE